MMQEHNRYLPELAPHDVPQLSRGQSNILFAHLTKHTRYSKETEGHETTDLQTNIRKQKTGPNAAHSTMLKHLPAINIGQAYSTKFNNNNESKQFNNGHNSRAKHSNASVILTPIPTQTKPLSNFNNSDDVAIAGQPGTKLKFISRNNGPTSRSIIAQTFPPTTRATTMATTTAKVEVAILDNQITLGI
jgi:hypothetical protein